MILIIAMAAAWSWFVYCASMAGRHACQAAHHVAYELSPFGQSVVLGMFTGAAIFLILVLISLARR